MAASTKVFVTQSASGKTWVDFGQDLFPFEFRGQEVAFIGSNVVDALRVRPGLVLDFTKSNGGIDLIFVSGAMGDYARSSTALTVTLTRADGTTDAERVVLNKGTDAAYDLVVFADGAARTVDLHAWAQGGVLPMLQPAPAPPSELNATIKAFAIDPLGEVFSASSPGMRMLLTGSNAIDTVYITAGSVVDASKLNGGADEIYFTGAWSDYQVKVQSTSLVFTHRVDGGQTTVAALSGAQNDRLFFADGSVLSNDARLALIGLPAGGDLVISSITGHAALRTTPSAAPRLRSALDNIADFDVSSPIVLKATQDVVAVAGRKIRIIDDGGTGFRGDAAPQSLVIDAADATQVSLDGSRLVIRPTQGLAFGRRYHVEVEAGAFVNARGVGSVPVQNGIDINFGTVLPSNGLLGLSAAAPSTALDPTGSRTSGRRWLDIEGVGSPSASAGTVLDVSSGDYALVFRDYETTTAADASFDGVGAPDFYVRARGFGQGDLIYVDNQATAQPNQLGVSSLGFTEAQTNPATGAVEEAFTYLSFGSGTGGLGGLIELVTGEPTLPQFRRTAEYFEIGAATLPPQIGSVAGDDIVNAFEQGVAITGTAEPGASVELMLGGRIRSLVADAAGVWRYTLTSDDIVAMGQGLETLSATATGVSGTVSSPATRAIRVDTEAPTLSPLALLVGSDSGDPGDAISNVVAPQFGVAVEEGASLSVKVGTGNFQPVSAALEGGGLKVTLPAGALSEGANTITLRAADAAGNFVERTGSYFLDTSAPALTIASDETAPVANIAGGGILYTFTFSQPVTGFSADDVAVTGGSKGTFSGVSSTVYTLVVHPSLGQEGTLALGVTVDAAQDVAGNGSMGQQALPQSYDFRAPTVAISDDREGTTNGDITYTFTFSEPVTGFGVDDVKLAHGTAGAFTASTLAGEEGRVYTLVVAPEAGFEGNVTVAVDAGAAFDLRGNASAAASQSVQPVDTKAPVFTSAATASFVENGTGTVYTASASDASGPVQYSLTGGADQDLFTIDGSTGALGFKAAPNFESPADAGANNVYNVQVTATDALGQSAARDLALTVTDVTELATLGITGVANGSVAENAAYAAAPTLTGTPIGAVTWTLEGADQGLFTVNPATGAMSMVARDFEAPVDVGGNNVYEYTLRVTDADGNTATQAVAVTVTNVADTAALTLSSAVSGVTNLDVTSALVLQASAPVTAVAGKFVRIKNDGGAGFRGEAGDNDQSVDVGGTAVTVQGNLIIIRPPFDLDLANSYHLEVDAGAFVAGGAGNAAVSDPAAMSFSTVVPASGLLGVGAAVSSQSMNPATGALQNSFKWLDVEGVGSPSAQTGTVLDLLSADVALVFKDYDAAPGSEAEAFDGVGAPDFYLRANNFGAGDLVYVDNQNPAQANLLGQSQVLADTPTAGVTQISFGTGVGGLGGVLEIDLAGGDAVFGAVGDLKDLIGSIFPPLQTD